MVNVRFEQISQSNLLMIDYAKNGNAANVTFSLARSDVNVNCLDKVNISCFFTSIHTIVELAHVYAATGYVIRNVAYFRCAILTLVLSLY